MQKLTGLERLFKAVHLQEPDVVPHVELLIDPKVRNAILPDASYEDFVEFMDLDAFVFHDKINWRYETLDASKKIMRDQWGSIVRFTSQMIPHPLEPAIKSVKDVDAYVPPDADLSWRYEKLEESVKRFKGEKAVIAYVADVFNVAKDFLLGDEEYFKSMIKNPDVINQVSEIVLNYNLKYIKNCLDVGADIVWIGGDWAVTQGPMVSPEFTKRFLVPPLRKAAEYAHSRGAPVFKHTDGNIWLIFDLIIEAGADAIHPLEPVASMDIGEAKAKYGHRVCLMGHIDCGRLLSWGTEEEVREEVKNCIRKAGVGGGLICGSSNSVHAAVNPANYVAMVKAIREYGQYPLNLD